jgi:hypothetical protein
VERAIRGELKRLMVQSLNSPLQHFSYWAGGLHLGAARTFEFCLTGIRDGAFAFYLHPWELDAEQPRMAGRITSRIRHYLGLRSTPAKFRRLIRDFEFVPLGSLIDKVLFDQPHSTGMRSIA